MKRAQVKGYLLKCLFNTISNNDPCKVKIVFVELQQARLVILLRLNIALTLMHVLQWLLHQAQVRNISQSFLQLN